MHPTSRAAAAICALMMLPGCGSTTEDRAPEAPPPLETLRVAGYTVAAGNATSFVIEDCLALESCFGNNASSAYLLFNVPHGEGQETPLDAGLLGELPGVAAGASARFAMRADEAIVLVGWTPPPSRYFGITPYIFDRWYAGERKTVFASLGDTWNRPALTTEPPDTDEGHVALIAAVDTHAAAAARIGLVEAGVPDGIIHDVPLPSGDLELGLGADADTLMLLGRVSLFEDPEQGERWLDELPWRVFRLTPDRPRDVDPLPQPAGRSRGTGTDEAAYAEALDALEVAIRERYAAQSVSAVDITSASIMERLLDPMRCMAQGLDCRGDNRDATYAVGPLAVITGGELRLSTDPGDFFVAFGVNHEASGKATYANVVVNNQPRLAGVAAFDSRQMPGSADRYLPDHPQKDALFAVHVRRDCADDPHPCLSVPTGFPGVGLDEDLFFIFRAYLEAATGTGPSPSELLTERVLRVQPAR